MMGLITSLIGPVTTILDKFVEDKDAKAKMAHEIATLAHTAALAQVEVNKAEAQHRSIFVAGWRPFVGWTCGVALAYHFVLQPIIVFVAAFYVYELPALPEFDMGSLLTVLMGMLGLGGLRTLEKTKGITK